MSLGVFLDVDGVLTREPINVQLARKLGVLEKFMPIEKDFVDGKIDNDGFNEQYIPLFRDAGLTKDKVAAWFKDQTLQVRDDAKGILQAKCTTYLLSCGPNFFVEPLAAEYKIPSNRVLCTQYAFTTEGKLASCISPVSAQRKKDFASERVRDHYVTIGVGNDLQLDLLFLTECHVKIVIGKSPVDGCLVAKNLQIARDMIHQIQEHLACAGIADAEVVEAVRAFQQKYQDAQTVFIMMPFREGNNYSDMELAIKEALQARKILGMTAADFSFNQDLWRNVQTYMIGCTYGIAVFCPDADAHGAQNLYNPNVALEAGFMLSRGKNVLLLKEEGVKGLFTDLNGFIVEGFKLNEARQTAKLAVQKWLATLR